MKLIQLCLITLRIVIEGMCKIRVKCSKWINKMEINLWIIYQETKHLEMY